MVRLVLKWLDSPWAFELLPGLNTLGRNPTNDFRISDPSVSSFHAEISVVQEQIRVRDLGSTNGTFIENERVEEGALLPRQVLRLGNVNLQLDEVPVVPVPQPGSDAPAEAPKQQAELHPSCTNHAGQRAAFKCENCAGSFCVDCVTVLGEGKFGATTVCPACQGQCYALASKSKADQEVSFLGRLTKTLKIPFTR